MLFVIVAENSLAKLLHLSDDVPSAIIAYFLHDIAQKPLKHYIRMGQ